ncbi:ABC1 kinase family protein [Capillimicrobium parvum]|uniref:Protein kinase UbiB n=1 Tax=Capillimicrobium parvum TaxID=2884022 RepID=A0A9E6XYA7_9ACTN|nr:AarF/ABC1/UbiB kinase family protein [Capillimicrobium parvum]UGS36709.1 protein kinase UbiB [Capillimicrobium parvum]
MSDDPEKPPAQAGRLPTGRLARTARVGGLVAGQGLRWAGMHTANRVRSPERAQTARNDRTAALVDQLVGQLGQMRGAAMKVGQMLSMVDFDGLPEDQRDDLQRRLAALRDGVPPVPFAKLEKLMRQDLGAPIGEVFADFEPHAFAAASIGQVHRATTRDGRTVAVKIQYPGVAEAVETDLRNATLLLPLVKRLAPGLDGRALAAEMRARISEELDYELEAQNQRRIERLLRGHPAIRIPRVLTDLSTRRVLVSEYVEGARFEEVRRAGEPVRDRYGEIVFRFFFGLLYREHIALGDPHPGNYLLCSDGRVCFLDFGLVRDVDARHLDGERALARAVRAGDAQALKAALTAVGYLPADRADVVDADWALTLMRMATSWYAKPGPRRFRSDDARRDHRREPVDDEQRDAMRDQMNQFTLPPESLLIRRMHGIVAVVLGQLRAGGDWGAIAAEYLHGEPPATPLGEQERAFLDGVGPSPAGVADARP